MKSALALRPVLFLAAVAVAGLCSAPVLGSVMYGTVGGSYTQDFDTLPNSPTNTSLQATAAWTDDTSTPGANQVSIPGWYLYHPTSQSEGGANGHQRLRAGSGNSNTGAFYSFGVNGTTDRALGDVGSNTLTPTPPTEPLDIYIGLRLTNDTGQTLYRFTLGYDGEQWRDGGATTPNAQAMAFGWSTTATVISDPNTSFTDVPALAFTSPVFTNTASGAAVDGNGAGKVTIGPVTVTGIVWAPGTDLWLRWDDVNNAGNDHGLAIDNLAFSADVPEPATLCLLLLGSVAMLRRGR
jgi:hypothetical protein